VPVFNSEFVNRQYFLFAQDSFRVSSRLVLNYGLRYEYFGAPHSIGSNRVPVFELGAGSTLPERLQNGQLNFSGGPAGLLYEPDKSGFAGRFGFSYRLLANTVLRGAYGIFYDRMFDNLWETARSNNLLFAQVLLRTAVDYSQPVAEALPAYAAKYPVLTTTTPNLTVFEPNLRNGYAQQMFLGIEHRLTANLLLDVNGMAALGRRLLTNDTLGYDPQLDGSQPGVPTGQLITYRGSQGLSDYYALATRVRYRRGRSFLQAAYTWSHSIDLQSDPLGLDLSDFGYSTGNLLPAVPKSITAGFSEPMNSRGDRGNSDFDERHNLVMQATYDIPGFHSAPVLPALTRGWVVSGVGAVRSGFPYTVYALGLTGKQFTRANIVDPALTRADHDPVPGGVLLLNAAGFAGPDGPGLPSGRNAFIGPGLINFDLGIGRSFAVRGLPESSVLNFRADMFNVLNHANLNNPYPVLVDGFGVATYGRNAIPAGFPTPLPLAETPRQIQLSVRLRF
jgi:hypothetical protein